jgi:hypothetical protein
MGNKWTIEWRTQKQTMMGKADQKGEEGDNKKEGDAKPSTITSVVKEPFRTFVPKALYLERLQAPKNGGKLEDILEVFKQVQINIPVLDAIQQIPSYAKFLKDLVIVKRKTNVPKKAFMTEQVNAILQCKLSLKYKDPGCPTITCMIGVSQIEKGAVRFGSKCEFVALLSLFAVRARRAEAYVHDTTTC